MVKSNSTESTEKLKCAPKLKLKSTMTALTLLIILILVATGSLNLEKNASAQMVEKTVTAARTAKYRGNVLHIKTNAAPTLVNMLTPHIPARTAIHKEGIALKEYVRRQIVSSLDGNIAALMTTIAVNFHAFETISVTIWLGLL
mmetsp:Transcript_3445/g.3927  ORF Transcript_3445/g.3927 Transcript_3445/m.3927 type:complete len:144 (-) Transcript_3445:791-1222(-)